MDIAKSPIRFSLIFKIAVPMMAAQASETVMLFTDRLFLSWMGKAYISGGMSGGLTCFTVSSLFIGIIGYVNAVSAQYYGAGKYENCAKAENHALLLSFLLWPLLILTIPLILLYFSAVGHAPDQISIEYSYYKLLTLGSIFPLLRTALTGFFIGIGKTRVVMAASILGVFINVPADYILIFGKLGFPALGIKGAAFATIFGSFCSVAMFCFVYFGENYNSRYFTRKKFLFEHKLFFTMLRFGTPAGVELFLNLVSFNLFVQFMHSYNADVAAAVTIALNYDLVSFVPMKGLGFAVTALVGAQIGAGNIQGVKKVLRYSWMITLSYGIMVISLFNIFPYSLVRIFTKSVADGEIFIVPLGVLMVRLVSIYTMADATNLVFAGSLRGAGDTKAVMLISTVLHWFMTVTVFIFVKIIKASPVSSWLVFVSFIVLMGISMAVRFFQGKWKEIKMI